MAPIYKGNTEVLEGQLKLGNQDVKEVYLGSEKIWPPAPKVNTVIYEHDVSPVAVVPDTSGNGSSVFFGNGYGLGFDGNMNNGGNPLPYRQVLMRKNTITDGDIDPMCVLYWKQAAGWGIPSNVCSHFWYPLVDVDSPDLPDGHKDLWDQIEVSSGKLVGSPIKGYKITFHKWHDMSRYTDRNTNYGNSKWCSPASASNQKFDSSTQGGGKISSVLNTPKGTLTSEFVKSGTNYADYLNIPRNGNPYGMTIAGSASGNVVAAGNGQGWAWGLKKVEIIL